MLASFDGSGMKRRFPGDNHGAAPGGAGRGNAPPNLPPNINGPQRPHDPRFPGRGGALPDPRRGGGPPNLLGRGRGPPPSQNLLLPPGRGPPHQNMGPGRGQMGRGPPHPNMQGRGGRDMMGRPQNMMGGPGRGMMPPGRGDIPGRLPMGGRGGPPNQSMPPRRPPNMPPSNLPPNMNVPPPPPRGPMGGPPFPRGGMRMPPPQPPHQNGPPRQMRHDFPGQQPPAGMPPHLHHRPPQPFQGPPQSHMQNGPGPGLGGGLRANYAPPNGFTHENLAPSQTGHPRPTPGAPMGYTPYPMGPGRGGPHDAIPTQRPAAGHAMTTTAPTTATNFTNEQIDQAWKEYTSPYGVNYYHNTATGESTYTKPSVLTKQDAAATPPPNTSSKRPWQEYEDATTGKTYYSDGVTTTWEKPAGFKSEKEKTKVEEEPPEPQKKKKKADPKIETVFNNREEAIATFKGLLLAKGLSPTLKWHEVMKLCSSDSRWEACEDALTVGERRQALAEYQTKRANELRTLERQERIRAKEAFGQLLTETLPSVPNFSAWSSNFSDVRAALSKDDRFYAVEEEGTRESLFLDFCEEFRKREERKKRSKKRDAHDALLSFFKEREEGGSLSFASTWESFVGGLDDSEKSDARFQVSPSMSDADRQLYFADFVIELQAAEDDKRRRIRDARRRAEKAQREGYRDTLRKLASEGKILPGTRWRSVEEVISAEESYGLVHTQDRDAPRELFEEFLDEWGENYRRDRSFLGQLLQPSSKKEIVVNGNTTYEEFTKMLLNEAAYSPGVYGDTRRIINRDDPISTSRLYYDDLVLRAKESDSAAAGRRGHPLRLGSLADSSEDEGEIIEEGEVTDDANGRAWAETRVMVDIASQQDDALVGNNAALPVPEISALETQNAAALEGEETGDADLEDLATPLTSAAKGIILQDGCDEGSKSLPVDDETELEKSTSPSQSIEDHSTLPGHETPSAEAFPASSEVDEAESSDGYDEI